MKQNKEFAKSKEAGWDWVKIWSTKYLICCRIDGLLENSKHKGALAKSNSSQAHSNISIWPYPNVRILSLSQRAIAKEMHFHLSSCSALVIEEALAAFYLFRANLLDTHCHQYKSKIPAPSMYSFVNFHTIVFENMCRLLLWKVLLLSRASIAST